MTGNPNDVGTRDVESAEARSDEIGLLLGLLQTGTTNMRGELGDVDVDTLIWQPYPDGHSIGAILIHVAACEAWWLHLVAAGQETSMDIEGRLLGGPSIDQYAGIWPTPPRRPLTWYYTQHDEIRGRTVALVRELLDPDEIRTVVWSPNRTCTVRWILHRVIEHEAYHLGQAVLLSLMKDRMDGGR